MQRILGRPDGLCNKKIALAALSLTNYPILLSVWQFIPSGAQRFINHSHHPLDLNCSFAGVDRAFPSRVAISPHLSCREQNRCPPKGKIALQRGLLHLGPKPAQRLKPCIVLSATAAWANYPITQPHQMVITTLSLSTARRFAQLT